MIHYPCGVMFVGERLVQHAPPIDKPMSDEAPFKIHPSGRSLSRMLPAKFRGTLRFVFTETWRINTICCLGPCVMVQAVVAPYVVYPYPQLPPDDGALYVIADRILEPCHEMWVEVECRPELFMLERDEDDGAQRSGFVDSKGVVHGDT